MADFEMHMTQAGIVAISGLFGGILTAVASRIKNGKPPVKTREECEKHVSKNDAQHAEFFKRISALEVRDERYAVVLETVATALNDLKVEMRNLREEMRRG